MKSCETCRRLRACRTSGKRAESCQFWEHGKLSGEAETTAPWATMVAGLVLLLVLVILGARE